MQHAALRVALKRAGLEHWQPAITLRQSDKPPRGHAEIRIWTRQQSDPQRPYVECVIPNDKLTATAVSFAQGMEQHGLQPATPPQ